jgi:alpha-L-fucosidase
MQEDIAAGERVRSFVIEEKIGRQWVKLVEGTCIGHKYIHLLPKATTAKQLRLRVLTSQGPLQLKHFAVY